MCCTTLLESTKSLKRTLDTILRPFWVNSIQRKARSQTLDKQFSFPPWPFMSACQSLTCWEVTTVQASYRLIFPPRTGWTVQHQLGSLPSKPANFHKVIANRMLLGILNLCTVSHKLLLNVVAVTVPIIHLIIFVLDDKVLCSTKLGTYGSGCPGISIRKLFQPLSSTLVFGINHLNLCKINLCDGNLVCKEGF